MNRLSQIIQERNGSTGMASALNADAMSGESASHRYARVLRENWEWYKTFGVPTEDYLNSMIGNGETLRTNLQDAQQYAQNIGTRSANETKRALAGYGLRPTADEAKVNNRLNQMNTVAAMSDARNAVRRNTQDLDRQILIGGAPNDGVLDV